MSIYKRNIKFLTKLQYTEIMICKLFEKNIRDELAVVHGLMSRVVLLRYFIFCCIS